MERFRLRIPMEVGAAFVLFLICGPQLSHQNPYCSINAEHTLCKFQGIGPRCKSLFEHGVPPRDRDLIMNLHNSFRMLVATGNELRGRPGPQPSAANMKQMVWDEELAATAQRLADQCKYNHDCLHCRKVGRFLVGQNLYQFSENIIREGSNWDQAIRAWYDEVADFHPRSVDRFEFKKELGHFTQILWADTDRVGCGYAYFNEGKWNRKLYICNYGPAGNIITTPMYTRGPACSQCPEGTYCSNQYPGLCTGGYSSGTVQQRPAPPPQPRPTKPPTTRQTTQRYVVTQPPVVYYPTFTTTTQRPTTRRPPTTTTPYTIPSFLPPIETNEIDFSNRFTNFTGFNKPSHQVQQPTPHPSYTTTRRSRYTTNAPKATTTLRPFGRFTTTRTQGTTRRTVNNFTARPPYQTTKAVAQYRPSSRPFATTTTLTPISFSPQIFFPDDNIQQLKPTASKKPSLVNANIDVPAGSIVPTANKLQRVKPTGSRITPSFNQLAEKSVTRTDHPSVLSVKDTNSILLYCDFDYAKCPIRFTGDSWNYTQGETPGFGRGFESVVSPSQLTNLYIRTIMHPSDEGNICLSFRFINYHFGVNGETTRSPVYTPGANGKPLSFRVTAGTLRQKPKIVEFSDVSSSPRDWLTANVQFRNLRSMFLLIFQLPTNFLQDNVYLAIDDILVTQGLCQS